ncbi:hypothetical protein [Allosphingosinicella sp.]|uniref:hypothetical protein n=1 Tax=Allosphingosinicella sp. TaxID=2823234 RepID=UPI002FC17914
MADSHPLPPRLLALLDDMPLEELAFAPVPVRARHDGWTVARQKGFILRLALGGCITVAAEGVGKTRKNAYWLRERPGAESAAAWEGVGMGQDRTVDVALERALLGERIPIVRDGRCVGERHRYDSRLTMTVLNALDRRGAGLGSGDTARSLDLALAELGRQAKGAPTENKGFSRQT